MLHSRAPFIVIEGVDGAGKTTHTARLASWLQGQGHTVTQFSFPRYGHPAEYFVQQYLDGKYGSLREVGPYRAAMLFALDRFDASFEIRTALEQGHIVLADRYVASNMASQGAKLSELEARQAYFKWVERLEYEGLGVPRPDLNLVLSMPAAQAEELMAGKKRDIHEKDPEHVKRSARTYDELCKFLPDHYVRIPCTKSGTLLPIDEIQAHIQSLVSALVARSA